MKVLILWPVSKICFFIEPKKIEVSEILSSNFLDDGKKESSSTSLNQHQTIFHRKWSFCGKQWLLLHVFLHFLFITIFLLLNWFFSFYLELLPCYFVFLGSAVRHTQMWAQKESLSVFFFLFNKTFFCCL